MLKGLIEVELPSAVDCILGDIEQIKPILFVDEAVGEDTEHLMHPDAAGLLLSLQLLLV